MKHKNTSAFSTKKLTVCAMLAALGVVMLYLGAFIEVLDISMAVIASFVCIIAVIEYGGSAPWLIYAVVSILSLILLPNKTPAAFFVLFFGFYPILKEKCERLKRGLAWILKEIIFNISLFVIVILGVFVLGMENNVLLQQPVMLAVIVVLSELVFVLYDIALTRLISFYIIKLRHRLKFK